MWYGKRSDGENDGRRNPFWLDGKRGNVKRKKHFNSTVKEQEVARLLLMGEGNSEIARELGVSTSNISAITKRTHVREKVMEMSNKKDDIVIEIEQRKLEARQKAWYIISEKLEEDLQAEILNTKTAFSVLAVAEPKQVNMNVQQAIFSLDDIKKAKEESDRLRTDNGKV